MNLQKPAAAFLDALDLKTQGRSPTSFSDTVFGSIDLMDHYLLTRQTLGVIDGNVQNIGDTLALTVPNGQVWRVHCASITVTVTGATTTISGRITYLPSIGAFRIALKAMFYTFTAAASRNLNEALWMSRPLLALPGSVIGFTLDSPLAAADVAALRTLHEVITI